MNFVKSLLLIVICVCQALGQTRTKSTLDFDWKFVQKDIKNAEQPSFDDASWRALNVPHDWSIEGKYDENNPSGKSGAFLPNGIGWYRKKISISKLESNDKYFVEFDGVYLNSDVWLNGNHLGFHPNGYMSFSYDLTPYLKEGDNILAVRVDHSKTPSGRWYTGSGIYRHVWLTKTEDIYIPKSGTYVTTPKVSNLNATVKIETTLNNESGRKAKVVLKSIIKDKNGNKVTESVTNVKLKDNAVLTQECTVSKPELWSPDTPNMYLLESVILVNGKEKDRYKTPFGIRKLEWNVTKGLLLNDKPILMKGLSNHQDAGAVGVAVPDDVLYRRLKMLKDMGCNALRTAHHPFSPEFYTMCDTLGFMVMDEAFDGWWRTKAKYDYGLYFKDHWQKDLKGFLKRDRNHPSVVIWSIGNEVHKFTPDEQKILVDFVKSVDLTRPVTQGRGYSAPYIDIAGFNGHGEFKGAIKKYHKAHPEKLIIGTEITHTLQTRGIYRTKTWYRTKDNPAPWEKPENFAKMEHKIYKIPDLSEEEVFTGITKKYQSSYDNSIVRVGVRDDWKRVEKYPYYIGNFRWTGFDYLGESFSWPARTANFGIIDLAGFPKDHYYLYQSLWSDKPMVHILPHWTHTGKEGVEIPVVVYTNCNSVELFLNGESLGEKKMGDERQIVWKVPYKAGELKAAAKKDGKVVLEKIYRTAGASVALHVSTDRNTIDANKTDIIHCEVTVVDKDGIPVPAADNMVNFEISGPAQLVGVENGDILDMSSNKVNSRKVFNGKCLLLLQSTGKSGKVVVKAKSKGLETAEVIVEAIQAVR